MSPPAATRTRMARPQRERQILAAAHAQFAARGFAAVTMDDVAAEVGVTKPLLYNYVGNKERLYLACLEEAAAALTRTLTAAADGAATPGDALRDGLRAFFAFVEEHRDRWRLLYDETLPASGAVAERVAAHREELARLVATLIEQLVEPAADATGEGPAAVPSAAADGLAHALLGAAEALARWWLEGEALRAPATAELLIAAVEPGMREAVAARRTAADPPDDSGGPAL
jgi:AcrR family transcriptional regulator